MMSRAKVALLRTTPATVLQDYIRLFELVELRHSLDRSAATTLVIDQRRYLPLPSANTTPWQLDGILQALDAAGLQDRRCIQPKFSSIDALKGRDLNGYAPILRSYCMPEFATQLVHIQARRPLPALERLCDGELVLPAALMGTNLVYLPTLKTDRAATLGGAVCCAAGSVFPGWPRLARVQMHELLADLMALQHELAAGVAAVMDGTVAGNGPGPYALRPEMRNVILASADPIALDAVAARLLGFDPLRDLEYLRLAHERGLGVADPRAIEVLGDAELAHDRWHFSAGGRPGAKLFGMLEGLAAGTPLADLLALGEASYHDFVRWPFAERQLFESWLHHSAWGQLFVDYQREGYGRATMSL